MGKGYVCCVLFLVACARNSGTNNNDGDCGDGHADFPEECDDGNTIGGDGCSASCEIERCGDHELAVGEECDDGNEEDGDGCSSTCMIEPRCGDHTVDEGEACDDGNTTNGDGCSSSCMVEGCGDHVIHAPEECDDGNTTSNDGCSSACQIERCGDHIQQTNEECDDGNIVSNDGCSSTCKTERCGDHITQPTEECDDGNVTNNDGCSATCKTERCGDHIQQTSEECDDGNVTNNDGCSSTCKTERCGDHVTQASEGCDDGNLIDGDGCSATCEIEVCGNGVVDFHEQCDDGNTVNGDGCSSTCHVELTRTITASWVTHDIDGATQSCLDPTITFHYRQIASDGTDIGPDQSTDGVCSSGFVASPLLVAGRYRVHLDNGTVASSVEKIVDVTSGNGTYGTVFITNGGYFQVAWRLVGVIDMTPHDCAYFGFGANGKVILKATTIDAAMTTTSFPAMCVDGFLVSDLEALPANTMYTLALDGLSSQLDALGHEGLGTYTIHTHNQITDVGLRTIHVPGF